MASRRTSKASGASRTGNRTRKPQRAASEVSESVSVHEGDLVTGQLQGQDQDEHLFFLYEKMKSGDRHRRRKGAEAVALYVSDGRVDPAKLEVHPADILGEEVTIPKTDAVTLTGSLAALAMMGPHAAEGASDSCGFLLTHSEAEVRFEAARALEAMGPGAAEGAAVDLGEALLSEEELNIRYMVAKALISLGPEGAENGAAGYVAKGLQDTDISIQLACGKALRAMGPAAAPEAAQALVDIIEVSETEGGHFEMRRVAAEALAAMGQAAAEVAALPLAKLLRVGPAQLPVPASSDAQLRETAARAIGAMGPEAVTGQQVRLSMAIGHAVGATGRGDCELGVQQAVADVLEGAKLETARKGSMAFFVDKGPATEPPPESQKPRKAASYSTRAFDTVFGDHDENDDEPEEPQAVAEDEATPTSHDESPRSKKSRSRRTGHSVSRKGRTQ